MKGSAAGHGIPVLGIPRSTAIHCPVRDVLPVPALPLGSGGRCVALELQESVEGWRRRSPAKSTSCDRGWAVLGARAVKRSEFLTLEVGEPGAAETAAVADPVPSGAGGGWWGWQPRVPRWVRPRHLGPSPDEDIGTCFVGLGKLVGEPDIISVGWEFTGL